MKIVDLEKLWNFVVDNFFYLNSFMVPNINLHSTQVIVWCSGRGVTREGEVAGLNPTSRVAREFYAKNVATCDFDGDWPVGASR
jgi:hypothetical protein